jgi:hypothetical protein
MGAAVSLTMYQRRRLSEGRKWLGQPRKGFGDHLARISPETLALLPPDEADTLTDEADDCSDAEILDALESEIDTLDAELAELAEDADDSEIDTELELLDETLCEDSLDEFDDCDELDLLDAEDDERDDDD